MTKYKSQKALIEKFDPTEIENNCIKFWEDAGVYKYDPTRPRAETFAIDFPPPTVSGSLHIGHIMSYSQAEIMARFHRMTGKNVFAPMGWDDNGLPTERRVQNYYGITCDPTLPYDPDFKPVRVDGKDGDTKKPVSRKNFIAACQLLIEQDEKIFEDTFRRMGFSYDWGLKYSTISNLAIKIAQENFLKLYADGNVKSVTAPTMWDTGLQSAVAAAEIEDRDIAGFFHDIQFTAETGDTFTIATTRPEFLPACIAVVAHPDDARYKHLFGKNAIVPLFNLHVPIMASDHADPDKGTGIMMVCTFGDAEDVKFWKEHHLPLRQIIGRDGRIMDVDYLDADGYAKFKNIIGAPIKAARAGIVGMLRESGQLIGEPRPITHSVKFFEKGFLPIEFVSSRQWFVGLMDKKDALLANVRKIKWTPAHMEKRLENWIDGLNQDWAISRQRFFGVPFPVWYKLDATGEPMFDDPILAKTLPCDPMADTPDGFSPDMRGRPNGFIGDPDVMDTWATSSLTPRIASAVAGVDLGVFDARPQAHDIIRTWAFYTIAQSLMNNGDIPWKETWISGFVLDPDRKKMSKSKGNVVVPSDFIEQYGADAVRLWAASSKLGIDGIADPKMMDQKRKLCMKFYNASKFVFGFGAADHEPFGPSFNPVDLAYVAKIDAVIKEADRYFRSNDYTGALIATEGAFWDFCDNYLEIVKTRAYGGDKSALVTLLTMLETFCGLFAPFMPFITEEVAASHPWNNNGKSIHNTPYPSLWDGFVPADVVGKFAGYDTLCDLVKIIRGEKTKNGFSMKKPIAKLVVRRDAFLESAADDIKNVLGIADLVFADLPGDAIIGELIWGE